MHGVFDSEGGWTRMLRHFAAKANSA